MSVFKLKLNLQKFGHFQQKCGKKTIGMVCLGNIHIVVSFFPSGSPPPFELSRVGAEDLVMSCYRPRPSAGPVIFTVTVRLRRQTLLVSLLDPGGYVPLCLIRLPPKL